MRVPNPDLGAGLFSGEILDGATRHRSYRTWMDLAEYLDLRLLTPQVDGDTHVILRFQVLTPEADWHRSAVSDTREKYGTGTDYNRIQKLEEPCFLGDYTHSLKRVDLKEGARILDLGINTGDEFAAFPLSYSEDQCARFHFTGIDHSASAIAQAKARFPGSNYDFVCEDLNKFWELDLPPQDLVVSIATLQSPGLDGKDLIIRIRQKLLKPDGAFILGFPNVRYLDGEIKQGARTKNYSEPELSLLIKDLFFYRRYLQQRGFRVVLSGKYYLFLTAWHPK